MGTIISPLSILSIRKHMPILKSTRNTLIRTYLESNLPLSSRCQESEFGRTCFSAVICWNIPVSR